MSTINLSTVDLNLLVALDALLRERSVTRAAKEVGIGQPAMSHALGRLRELLGDPLLIRRGRAMVPTPRAEALALPVEEALAAVRAVLRVEPAFDPATSERSFVLACPDLVAPMLPVVLRAVRREAPGVNLAVIRPEAGMAHAFEHQGADLALGAERNPGPGITHRRLGRARWATLARPSHPYAEKATLERWLAAGHVQVSTGGRGESFVDAVLRSRGLRRRVALTVPAFLLVPQAVAAGEDLYTGPEPFLRPLAESLGLMVLEPPVPLPAAPVVMAWPTRLDADAGVIWLRGLVGAATSALLARGATTRSG